MNAAHDILLAELTAFLADRVGTPVSIENLRRLVGGASMETWALDGVWEGNKHPLILRRDMGTNMYEGALSRAQEFALLAVAHRGGILAPAPLFLNERSERPFFLMERLPGISVGPKVVRDPALASGRAPLAAQMGEQLAKIHCLNPVSLTYLPRPLAGANPAVHALRIMAQTAKRLDPANAVWAYGLRWLELRLPPPVAPTVLHGDFRIGNLLVTPEGLSGVLDWEFAHLGDPAEDLAWPLVRDWRFGNDHLRVGGVGSLDDYLAAYAAAGGQAPDSTCLRWWEVAGNLRWAIFALAQAERHLSGADRSVELASLGRKAAEMEWEVLRLIEETN